MNPPQLIVEVLNGPLDGAKITVQIDTEWCKTGDSPLAFPWDANLGEPQARFFSNGTSWNIEGYAAGRRTHLYRGEQDIIVTQQARPLEKHDLLKAGNTMLLVEEV
jgi:hypothetical protein